MTLNDFLVWLTAGGASIAASWGLEQMEWFQNLDGKKKQYVFFAACLLLSFAAFAVQTYVPVEILNQLTPWFALVSTAFGGIFAGSLYHRSAKKVEDGLG